MSNQFCSWCPHKCTLNWQLNAFEKFLLVPNWVKLQIAIHLALGQKGKNCGLCLRKSSNIQMYTFLTVRHFVWGTFSSNCLWACFSIQALRWFQKMTSNSTAIASCKCIFQKCISRKCILFFKSVFLKCVFFESVFVKCVFVKSVFLKCVFVTSVFVKSVFSKKKYFPAGSSGELHSKLSKSTAAQSPPPALKRKWAQIYCTATFLVPFLSAQFYFSQFALSLEIQLNFKKKLNFGTISISNFMMLILSGPLKFKVGYLDSIKKKY